MNGAELLALAVAMALLAAMPSVSVLAVTARAATGGFAQGAWTAAGIVVADLLFVLLAVFGLRLLVEALGPMFVVVERLGGLYVLVLGLLLLRGQGPSAGAPPAVSGRSSFAAGLLITLGDQKAVLFYLGFLPAFVDLQRVRATDVAAIAAITLLAVGGMKLVYAWLAARAGRHFGPASGNGLARLAAAAMIAAGSALLLRSLPGG